MTTRAPTDAVQLKFRVQEALRARLEEAAIQRHVSLNAEITGRLEKSFNEPYQGSAFVWVPSERDRMEAASRISPILSDLYRLQSEILDLAVELPAGEAKDRAMAVAHAMSRPNRAIYQELNALLTRRNREGDQ